MPACLPAGHQLTCLSALQLPQLFSRNADVDRVNADELARLPGTPAVCEALDEVTLQDELAALRGAKPDRPLSSTDRER